MYWSDRPALVPLSHQQPDGGSDGGSAGAGGAASQPGGGNSLAERAARLSFAALQGVPQESSKDQLKLLRAAVNAMKTSDTRARLDAVQVRAAARGARWAPRDAGAALAARLTRAVPAARPHPAVRRPPAGRPHQAHMQASLAVLAAKCALASLNLGGPSAAPQADE